MTTYHGAREVLVVAFALNGTLTDDRGRVAEGVRAGIRRMQDLGLKTILITGCTRDELTARRESLVEFDAVVLESGTIRLDNPSQVFALPTEAVTVLRDRCEDLQIPCRVGLASLTVPAAFGRKVCSWPEASQVTIHVSQDRIDITPAGHDKGTGLRRVLTQLDYVPSDCLVFGDSPSDLPMFAVAGYSVAVANAEPSVLEAADEVAPGYGGDAVADFLEKRILGDH